MTFQPDVNMPDEINQIGKPLKGVIVENKDSKQLRRCKVKVEGLIESLDNKSLPWAAPKSGQGSGGRAAIGSFDVPEVNTVVEVTFPNGDINSPHYANQTDEVIDSQVQKLFSEDYPSTRGRIHIDGTWQRQNEKQKYDEDYHISERYIQTDKDGNVMIYVPKNVSINIGGNFCMQVQDLISIFGNNNLGINISSEIGIHNGSTFGVDSGGHQSFQAPHIHLNDGIIYGTAKAAKQVLDKAIEMVMKRVNDVVHKLRVYLQKKDQAAQKHIQTYHDKLMGNCKS